MSKLIKINNFRIKISSHEDIYDNIKSYKNKVNFNNDKIINLNNFKININNKKINYTLYYTNPYKIRNKISEKILYNKISNSIVKNLCYKIFIDNEILSEYDLNNLNKIVSKKYKTKNYIDMGETFIIMYFIIKNKYSDNKEILIELLKYHFIKFILNTFSIVEIINGIIYPDIFSIDHIKFYTSFYILAEEFHYKYIIKYLYISLNDNNIKDVIIFNSNYIKLNPQEIITNTNGEYYPNKLNLLEFITVPFGHNIILIYNLGKIYYYDSDEQILSDIYKLKKIFSYNCIGFINISNRNPIQNIFDDGNCVFYCLRFIEYLIDKNINFNMESLKLNVLLFENEICNKNDMLHWILNFINYNF